MSAQFDDLIEHALSDSPFRGFGDIDDIVVGDDGDGVAVGSQSRCHSRETSFTTTASRDFGDQFRARAFFQNVFGLGGKSDDDLRLLPARQVGQDIWSWLQI